MKLREIYLNGSSRLYIQRIPLLVRLITISLKQITCGHEKSQLRVSQSLKHKQNYHYMLTSSSLVLR